MKKRTDSTSAKSLIDITQDIPTPPDHFKTMECCIVCNHLSFVMGTLHPIPNAFKCTKYGHQMTQELASISKCDDYMVLL